jgi:hypothetical protein
MNDPNRPIAYGIVSITTDYSDGHGLLLSLFVLVREAGASVPGGKIPDLSVLVCGYLLFLVFSALKRPGRKILPAVYKTTGSMGFQLWITGP